MLMVGQQEGHPVCKKLSCGTLVWLCLGQDADLHIDQLMPLPLTISCSSKSRSVLPFWCRLTWVALHKIQRLYLVVCVIIISNGAFWEHYVWHPFIHLNWKNLY